MGDDLFENYLWDLSNYRPNEVSLVDEGAIQIPFLIIKEANNLDKKKLLELIQKTKLNFSDDIWNKIAKEKLADEEINGIKAAVGILKAYSDKVEKSGIADLLLEAELIEVEPGDVVSKEDHEAAIAKAKEEAFAEGKKEGQAEKPAENESAVDKAKKAMEGLDEGSKSLIEALISQTEKAISASEESQKALAAAREEKIVKEFEAKAQKFKLGVDGLGAVLKDVATNCSEESYKKLESILTVAADKSSFEATPGAGDGEANASDSNQIYGELERKAKAAFPDCNSAEAVTKFMVTPEGKELYARFDKARQK